MKKIKFIQKSILIAALGLGVVSCEDYLDVNDNPNGAGIENLTPDLVMPGAMHRPSIEYLTNMNQLGNTMIATWTGNTQAIQAPFSDEFNYNITSDFYDTIWDRIYIRTANLTHIINYSSGQNYDYHKAAAKILKSFYFQNLVDVYGDLPYTQAHLRGENLFPAYDSAPDIYNRLITQIDEAIDMIDNTNTSSVTPLGASDIMLGGNMDHWKKFANTLKLRLLIRKAKWAQQSGGQELTDFNAQMATLNQPGVQFLSVGEDVKINAGYQNEVEKQSPMYEAFGYLTNGNETIGQRQVGPTQFLIDILDGTTTTLSDPRLDRLYEARAGQTEIIGLNQGTNGAPAQLGDALVDSFDQDGIIMTAAESLFLQAEAAQEGYLTGIGSAESLFKNGITASFNLLEAPIGTYLTTSDNLDLIGWNSSTDKIELIITQKWLALGSINGLETWIEYNRTGYPANMPFPQQSLSGPRPVRLLYPTSEYTGNTANVSAYQQNAQSAFNDKIFWDIN
ncbi:MAG: SusD/RagB family nutrient-binding outer membrane lipoprotein [Flavobacteriaceae bacterium]